MHAHHLTFAFLCCAMWTPITTDAFPTSADSLYAEQFRPLFHYSPPQQWMNDPNGMVYLDGEYHLYYQFNPYANVWGPMHWGHAVSRDLVHWENLPIALFPDRNGTIFSGSAVFDSGNTSQFGTQTNPPLVAIYTYHDHLRENLGASDFQSQGIAYSLDRGRNWTKYSENPVLRSSGSRDFRDPKVFWYEPGKTWIMTLAVHDHVAFYSSPDLKHWSHESDFGREHGAHGGVWECPDLIDMPVVGESSRRSVLLVSINPGGPNGGSATQYFVGRFDGHKFELDAAEWSATFAGAWVDYGTDDYAGSTWSGGKPGDQRQLFLGWMSNWQYARNVPTERWRSAMTIPRVLNLVRTPRGLELHSESAAELKTLRTGKLDIAVGPVEGYRDLNGAPGARPNLMELELDLNTGDAGRVELIFGNDGGQQTIFRVDKAARRYEIDRSASGLVDFYSGFTRIQSAPLIGDGGRVAIHAFVDHSSLELFINGGETVFTTIDFPSKPYDKIEMRADKKVSIVSGAVYTLGSIWPK